MADPSSTEENRLCCGDDEVTTREGFLREMRGTEVAETAGEGRGGEADE